VLGLVVAALLATSCAGGPDGSDGSARSDGAPIITSGAAADWKGTAITNPYPLPDQEFTDTAGSAFVLASDADAPVTLVFFGYTHCPDICNIVLANIAAALRGASPEVRDATELVFVSTDPARDTPEVVRDYLDRFDPAYAGLVAPVATVEQAARDLYISYERPDGTTGGYEVEHGAYTTAFVDGEARVVWAEDVTVADLRADLTRLARAAQVA